MPDGSQLSIRDCSENDILAIQEIENRSFDDPYSKDLFKSLLGSGATFKVAEIKSTVVGYCIYKQNFGMLGLARHGKATLISLAVHPDWKRRSIGSLLLKNTIDDLTNSGIKSIELQVMMDNEAAKALYKKFGFAAKGKIPNYYGRGKDALVMEKNLP